MKTTMRRRRLCNRVKEEDDERRSGQFRRGEGTMSKTFRYFDFYMVLYSKKRLIEAVRKRAEVATLLNQSH